MQQKGTVTTAHLETVYQVMVKRIAKGFTAKRLSFYASAEEDFIEQVESLQLPIYDADTLECLADVLDEEDPKCFLGDSQDTTMLNVIIDRVIVGSKLVHSYFMMDKDLVPRQLFMLKEDIAAEIDEKLSTCADMELAADAFDVLLRSGYLFEGKPSANILKRINNFIYPPLNPLYIEMAIGRYSGKDGNSKEIKMLEDVLHGRVYEEC